MIIALKWLWMTLNWPQMYLFWKYTKSNADSRFLMHNNKKSIEIDFLFGMIIVLRVFCVSSSFWNYGHFKQKSIAQILKLLSLFYDSLERYIFSFLWQKNYYHFEVDKRVCNLSISKGKSVTHLKMKGIKSSRNDSEEIISKWEVGHSFKNDSFPKINLQLI